MIPEGYTVTKTDNGWRLTSPTDWWVEFRTEQDMRMLWEGMRYYLDQPPKSLQ